MTTAPVSPALTTTVHKQSFITAAFAAITTGGGAAYLSTVAHAHIASFEAVLVTAIAAVGAFATREAPYIKDVVRLWNLGRKNKKIAAVEAKATAQADALIKSPAVQAAIAAAVEAAKAAPSVSAAVSSTVSTVETAATVTPAVATVEAPVTPVA